MSICALTEDTRWLDYGTGLIDKIVTCDLKNPYNYLEGLAIITTFV